MSEYVPDKWAIVELKTPKESVFKVLASWYGGYLGSDSWKMSSGLDSIVKTEHGYEFHNFSGSVYKCHKEAYGMSMYTTSVYLSYEKQNTAEIQIRLLDEEEIDKIDLSSCGK
jgi:hypothetical protein